MNKRLLLCALIVPGALAVSPMVSAQAQESVSLKEYQQAKASQAVSLNQAMVMAFENSPVLALRRAAVSIQQGQLCLIFDFYGRLVSTMNEEFPFR